MMDWFGQMGWDYSWYAGFMRVVLLTTAFGARKLANLGPGIIGR
jgi:hypothetical protein